jgi:hypothetical protein
MEDPKDRENLEMLSAIMAELRADAKPLARDLVRGVNAYALLALVSVVMTAYTLILVLMLLFPKYYVFPLEGLYSLVLLSYPVVGVYITYKALRRYSTLSRKYSRLIAMADKLED